MMKFIDHLKNFVAVFVTQPSWKNCDILGLLLRKFTKKFIKLKYFFILHKKVLLDTEIIVK